jgi:hypothetical protein
MRHCALRFMPLVALGCSLLCTSRAEAELPILTFGESVTHVGNVPSALKEQAFRETQSSVVPEVGFISSGLGVFGLDFWTWDGRYCLYAGNV